MPAPAGSAAPAAPSVRAAEDPASPSAGPSAATVDPVVTGADLGPPVDLGPVGVAGVNDAGCTSAEPPVVLLHGTLSRISVDYPVLVPALRAAGRCVYGVDDARAGMGPLRASAAVAAAVVHTVLERTGSDRVDVVGFSQGGLVLRTALRLNGIADAVRVAVLISPSFHGTTSALVDALPAAICPACADQAAGSPLLTELAVGGDLDGDVRYAVAVTSTDEVVTPWQSQLPTGPADRVRSVIVDQQCPGLAVRHQDMARHPIVVDWVVAALADPAGAPAVLAC